MTKGNGKRVLRRLCAAVLASACLLAVAGDLTGCILTNATVLREMNKSGYLEVDTDGSDALFLSEYENYRAYYSQLQAQADVTLTPVNGATIPEDLEEKDGDHHGLNFAAYTFYCRNMGAEPVDVDYELYIVRMSPEMKKAARIRLITEEFAPGGRNVSRTDYALACDDGTPEPGTEAFAEENIVVKGTVFDLAPDASENAGVGNEAVTYLRFTVAVWLEGKDPDCEDGAIGTFKLGMLIGQAAA